MGWGEPRKAWEWVALLREFQEDTWLVAGGSSLNLKFSYEPGRSSTFLSRSFLISVMAKNHPYLKVDMNRFHCLYGTFIDDTGLLESCVGKDYGFDSRLCIDSLCLPPVRKGHGGTSTCDFVNPVKFKCDDPCESSSHVGGTQ